jgi:hypothetical protein
LTVDRLIVEGILKEAGGYDCPLTVARLIFCVDMNIVLRPSILPVTEVILLVAMVFWTFTFPLSWVVPLLTVRLPVPTVRPLLIVAPEFIVVVPDATCRPPLTIAPPLRKVAPEAVRVLLVATGVLKMDWVLIIVLLPPVIDETLVAEAGG